MNEISAVIIAKNEEEQIAECLESVFWCDEIIVIIDDRTSDRTEVIARKYTEKVFLQKWLGYGPQKNLGIEKASNDWILSLDADERVSPELVEEIQKVLENPSYDGYYILFHTYIGGRRLRFGGMQNDWHLRLFRKSKGRFGGEFGGTVHERVEIENAGHLKSPIFHYTYKDVRDLLKRVKTYSQLEAEDFIKNKKTLIFRDYIKPFLRFLNIYFRKLGFLDGWLGFINAVYLSYYLWYRNQLIRKTT